MQKPFSSIACNLDTDILTASLPLLEQSKVEGIEWSFDTLFGSTVIPEWFRELLLTYSRAGRLVGHGVFFSLFTGRWLHGQQQWLDQLRKIATEFPFDHVTEHFGFMTGRDFHQGAPINIPFTGSTLAIGRDRLKRIQDAAGCAVGLENLAFAYSLDEVKRHGDFLQQLLLPVNGFIILDLHNLYCQLHNFNMDFEDLIELYPLDKVREIHISGGSFEDSILKPVRSIRRDTHDDRVPEAVFQLLEQTIPRCPNLRYVVLEQLGTALNSAGSKSGFREDFDRMDRIVKSLPATSNPTDIFLPHKNGLPFSIAEDEVLYQQQRQLSEILETSTDGTEALARLRKSALAGTAWDFENWDPYMLETAVGIARKWK
ncbi:MAG: DUF692 family protein [Chitinophagaceae bacterium]|nr:MAG: DUF692 family protein [Chitinophagaceae bacterium]